MAAAPIGQSDAAQRSNHSKRLLNHIVDDIARDNPGKIYAELPLSPTSFEEGFRKVSYRELSNAINGVAWWLNRSLGPGKDFKTLVYLGPNDLRHTLLLLGAVKAGFKMLFTSPRYGVVAQVDLLKRLGCTTMLVPTIHPPVTKTILETYNMQTYQVPELKYLLDQNHPHCPYEKTFAEARSEPLVVLHTSGTTGLPKPIIWTHDWAASFAEERYLSPPPGFESLDRLMLGVRLFSLMPPFHASGLFGSLFFSICCGTTMIYPPSDLPPTIQMAVNCLKHTKADIISMIPPYVEELEQKSEVLEFLSHNIETVMWAGGSISTHAGNVISSKLKLWTICGSTEMGLWPTIRRQGPWPSDQWKSMRFHPAMNMAFHHRSDGLFEAYIRRNPDLGSEQPIFKVFPDLQEYDTGDLFSPDPSDSQLWQYRGRADDMQVFSSGEKYHPTALEQRIAQHPDVKEVLLVGTGRPQGALLLEMSACIPCETSEQQVKAIEKLWPTIEEVNQTCPEYAKVTKQHILFVELRKPMARSGKGTVQRPATIKLYEAELDKLFEKAKAASAPAPPTAHSLLTYSTAMMTRTDN